MDPKPSGSLHFMTHFPQPSHFSSSIDRRTPPRDGAAFAVHALVVADTQRDGSQAQRLFAFHDALSAAVALLFVDDVLVEVVGRVFGIHLANRLSRRGVGRAAPLAP